MASGSGFAGLAVTALVAALVALGASALVQAGRAPAPPAPPPGRVEDAELRREVDRLRREVEELRAARPVRIGPRPKGADPADAGAPGGAPSPGTDPKQAPAPATRGELVALIDERIDARAATGSVPGVQRKKVSIEEAGTEMGLSSVEIDTARRIWRDSENEMLMSVLGTTDLDLIKEEVKAAAEDPDRKAALINKGVGNFVRNLGRIMTIEDRRDRELKKFLSEEQMKKLKGYDIKSTLEDPELEDVVEKVFNNR